MPATQAEIDLPAVAGGKPVRTVLLPYGHQYLGQEEELALLRVSRSSRLTQGPEVNLFERQLGQVCGARHTVAFSSGTTALHGCLAALGIGPGDEVIVPAMTFVATCNAVVYVGARPVIADVEPDTLNLSPRSLEQALSPATRAVIAVHYAGHPADMNALLDIASRRRLALVEDAAHALGSAWLRGNKRVTIGSLPDSLASFSFHPVKAVTTAEGGAVATASSLIEHRLRSFRHHGIDGVPRGRPAHADRISMLGINGRMSELQAAIGTVQLGRLSGFLDRRRAIADDYLAELGPQDALIMPVERPGCVSSWHIFPVRLRPGLLTVSRNEIFSALRAEGIGVQVHYVPLHYHPQVRKRARLATGLRQAELAYENLLTLPLWPGMSNRDTADVIEAVLRVIRYFRR